MVGRVRLFLLPALAAAALAAAPGGAADPFSATTRGWADAQLAPYVCDPSQGVPGSA